jgi:DNA polymerase III delta subunit
MKSAHLAPLLSKNSRFPAILLYGSSPEVIFFRENQIVTAYKNVFPAVFVQDSGEKDLSSALNSSSPGLFDRETPLHIYKINECKDSIAPQLADLTASLPENVLLVFKCASLKSKPKLKSFFEKHPLCPLVPCYSVERQELHFILTQTLKQRGFTYDTAAFDKLVQVFEVYPERLQFDLEKLFLWLHPLTHISLEALDSLFDGVFKSSLDALCLSMTQQDAAGLVPLYHALIKEGVELIYLQRTLLKHFLTLFQVVSLLNEKISFSEIRQQVMIPLYLQKAPLLTLLKEWSLPVLKKALLLLAALEKKLKSGDNNVDLQCLDILLQITSLNPGKTKNNQ